MSTHMAPLREFLDGCIGLDEALLLWRDRHVRFVESMIGRRMGTGGGGTSYLRQSVDRMPSFYRTHAFPCLWHSRSILRPS